MAKYESMNCSGQRRGPCRYWKVTSRVRMGFQYAAFPSTPKGLALQSLQSKYRALLYFKVVRGSSKIAIHDTSSSEPDVKLVDLSDTTKITTLRGHTKAVRKATWHPSGTYLVSTIPPS